MNPKISIIMPTYGGGEYLDRAVKSAIGQSYKNFELIVIDDNNPDTPARIATERLIEPLLTDERVKYIQHTHNKNGAAARNTGINAANGEWIAFLDDDDYFLPEKLKTQMEFAKENPQFDAVYCGYIQKGREYLPTAGGDLSFEILSCSGSVPTTTILMKKSALIDIGGFNESYRRHQDLEMLMRFFTKYRIIPVPKILAHKVDDNGANKLHGKDLEALKEKFLNEFSQNLKKLPKSQQKKAISYNWAEVWADYLHYGPIKDAWRVFLKNFTRYPIAFFNACLRKTADWLAYKLWRCR